MNDIDKQLFASDTRTVDLIKNLPTFLLGLRVYIAEDPLDTVKESMKRKTMQLTVHLIVKYTFYALFIFILYKIFW